MTTEALAPLRRSIKANPVAIRKLIVFACCLVTAVTLVPVVMMVLVAFQSDAESMAARPSFWPSSLAPGEPHSGVRPRPAGSGTC